MEVIYAPKAVTDIALWKASGNAKAQKRITQLIASIQETPFEGIGKPEALKHNWSGCWSRRITQAHRLIYDVTATEVHILSMRDHY